MSKQAIKPNWPAPYWIKAYTTVRDQWGHDGPPFKSAEKEQALIETLQLPSAPCWITQKHTALVANATPNQPDLIADASYTDEPNRVCAVLTADCLPILICNVAGTHVAAIHAGWRGLAQCIIAETIQALALPVESLLVWLGPGIGASHFEVGKDVFDAFVDQNKQAESAFQPLSTPHKWLADLYLLAKQQLNALGITAVYHDDYCTYRDATTFYSYRREAGETGRMASVIWIEQH